MKLSVFILLLSGLMSASIQMADAQVAPSPGVQTEIQPVDKDDEPSGYPNWKTKTFGGAQFWTDVRFVGGWRIQRNSETQHFRLLDPKSHRHAWGNLAHCNQSLDQLIVDGQVKPCSGKVVIVLHGLIRTKSSMQPLADYLHKKGDYTTINFQYASTRNGVSEHAADLKNVIDHLGSQVTEIYFVGHSLGNLVVRRYLADNTDPKTLKQGDPRIKRMVMLGPPNQGSRMARILKTSFLFQTIAGVSGSELSRTWDKLKPTLATPQFEFGIIAGGQQSEKDLSNFVLKGQDDFTVSIEETKLVGAHDFLVRPLLHPTMMRQPDVFEATLNFFKNGYFVSKQEQTPLLESPPNEPSTPSDRSSS